ncbi:hypothetical protein AAF712_011426 [Marasmius tenuissimus]|uniref:Uncharacterized protein n=1 Tax=Marasmius tenuissimus TaxID=585030 RepID=A0ABR2ZMY9_9AGAR
MQIKQLALFTSVLPAVLAGVIPLKATHTPSIPSAEDLVTRQLNDATGALDKVTSAASPATGALGGLPGGLNGRSNKDRRPINAAEIPVTDNSNDELAARNLDNVSGLTSGLPALGTVGGDLPGE